MSTQPVPSGAPEGKDQRDRLEESFEKATEQEPSNFRDEATEDKVVEIPADKTNDPIRGIDAPERPGR
jgi:hypothetical protein